MKIIAMVKTTAGYGRIHWGGRVARNNRFARFFLPGLAFKAAVIGGGYATGRELATFFVPSGPMGGLAGIVLAMVIWSIVCTVTFVFAHRTASRDYRTFFRNLLGPFWPAYEITWFLALMLILAVYAAAAGAIGHSLFGWSDLIGALLLIVLIVGVVAWGNYAVERLFNYVSILLYGTYAAFVLLSLSRYGDRIAGAFAAGGWESGWAQGGVTYAGYNIIGAIVILPVTRHLTSSRDAVVAGMIAGPLAMLPAILFFVCMVAWFPSIANEPLPSDFLLERLGLPWFRILFQLMIFAALLESAASGVHSINERVATVWRTRRGTDFSAGPRVALTLGVLAVSVFVAGRYGLVALIAQGYSWLAAAFLLIYVLPLMTLGLWRLARGRLSALPPT
jgi:uncharacterized membrane protein YkvI